MESKELEARVSAMAAEYQAIISSLSQRCAQLAADNGALKMKMAEMTEAQKTTKEEDKPEKPN